MSLKIISFLNINRIDLAENELNQMKKIDEDNCLTTLSHLWINVFSKSSYFFIDS